MADIIASPALMRPQGRELLEFNSRLAYLEWEYWPSFRPLKERTEGWTYHLDQELGLLCADEFAPLTWVALADVLIKAGSPYPRRLIATVDYFFSQWDAEAFVSTRQFPRYPCYVQRHIVEMSIAAAVWLAALTEADVC